MLLVTFHGGKKKGDSDVPAGGSPAPAESSDKNSSDSQPITNVYAYDTKTGDLKSHSALKSKGNKLDLKDAELRGMAYDNSYLYVVNGKESKSSILAFQYAAGNSASAADLPDDHSDSGYHFDYVGDFIGPSLNGAGLFQSAIGHPYSMVFWKPAADPKPRVYISNQDTNAVARAQVNADGAQATMLANDLSDYLKSHTSWCPEGGCVYLDGTFVASQVGTLPGVAPTTPVAFDNGGLQVAKDPDGKVQNSVRDVLAYNNTLLVCDEAETMVRLYGLPAGEPISHHTLAGKPTHLAIFAGGLYVSADDKICWSSLASFPALSFTTVLTAPSGSKVGGMTFSSDHAYVAFQQGTGGTGTGAIYRYKLGASPASPPVFPPQEVFADKLTDTPEFLLYLPI